MKSLRLKLVSALAMFCLVTGLLLVGIFAAQTQTITMQGSVNFEIADKSLYIQDVRVQMDNNSGPYSLKEQGEFLPGYINGNFNMNLGSLNNTYGSFALYFDIVNLKVDGQTAVYNAEATTTQDGVSLETSGEILGAELSSETVTADELNNPANLSGTIKLLVTATSVPTVYLNQITVTINEAERLQSVFVFTPLTENTVELTYYLGGETDIVIPESYSVVESEFTNFELNNISAIGNNMTYMASLIYGTWNYTDNNNNTGALNYFAMDGSVDLSSLAMPLQVDVDYVVNLPVDNASSLEYFVMYLQGLEDMRDQYGLINGGVYATFNGYERKLYTIEELNSFITTTFGDYNSDPSVLQNALPATLELENPLKETIYYAGNTYTVTSLGDYCLNEYSIDSVTIPKTVTHIGDTVFYNTGCGYIYFQGSLEQWCKMDIEELPSNFELYINGEKLVNANIPEGITSLLDLTFIGCKSLTSVVLPPTLIAIGNSTFSGCSNLTNVDLSNCARLTRIGADAFSDCNISPNFTDDYGVNYFGNDTNPYMILLDDGTLSDSSYIIPDTCITILENAFDSNSTIASITLSSRLTSINSRAFYNCSGLTGELVIPEGVTSIGSSAFCRCSGLTSITLPSSLKSIGTDAFSSCSGLETLEYKGTIGQWLLINFNSNWITNASYTFIVDGEELTNLVVPENTTTIPQYAFYLCDSITNLDLSNCTSLTSIGSSAFSDCDNLISIDLSNCSNLTSIGGFLAFANCSNLTSIDLSNCTSLTSIGSQAFWSCGNLTNIDLSNCENLTNIVNEAFRYDTSLNSVTLNEYIFENISSASDFGYLLYYIDNIDGIVRVPETVIDGGAVSPYLDQSGTFTRDTSPVDGYYIYRKA